MHAGQQESSEASGAAILAQVAIFLKTFLSCCPTSGGTFPTLPPAVAGRKVLAYVSLDGCKHGYDSYRQHPYLHSPAMAIEVVCRFFSSCGSETVKKQIAGFHVHLDAKKETQRFRSRTHLHMDTVSERSSTDGGNCQKFHSDPSDPSTPPSMNYASPAPFVECGLPVYTTPAPVKKRFVLCAPAMDDWCSRSHDGFCQVCRNDDWCSCSRGAPCRPAPEAGGRFQPNL